MATRLELSQAFARVWEGASYLNTPFGYTIGSDSEVTVALNLAYAALCVRFNLYQKTKVLTTTAATSDYTFASITPTLVNGETAVKIVQMNGLDTANGQRWNIREVSEADAMYGSLYNISQGLYPTSYQMDMSEASADRTLILLPTPSKSLSINIKWACTPPPLSGDTSVPLDCIPVYAHEVIAYYAAYQKALQINSDTAVALYERYVKPLIIDISSARTEPLSHPKMGYKPIAYPIGWGRF